MKAEWSARGNSVPAPIMTSEAAFCFLNRAKYLGKELEGTHCDYLQRKVHMRTQDIQRKLGLNWLKMGFCFKFSWFPSAKRHQVFNVNTLFHSCTEHFIFTSSDVIWTPKSVFLQRQFSRIIGEHREGALDEVGKPPGEASWGLLGTLQLRASQGICSKIAGGSSHLGPGPDSTWEDGHCHCHMNADVRLPVPQQGRHHGQCLPLLEGTQGLPVALQWQLQNQESLVGRMWPVSSRPLGNLCSRPPELSATCGSWEEGCLLWSLRLSRNDIQHFSLPIWNWVISIFTKITNLIIEIKQLISHAF